ncbi:hypothetical protein HUT19_23205 [Streptomyces sp. NA02950]|uniref:hypothetical protein n=1 Tax=Streptomyces sp. NA02950 TaxID=2742137 RepID=UPI00158FCD12|nr:hypothetical protein [Streptomyces sp. NA02950]QKV94302.1 hypothetical protein HUT19_23205 [Streptomyces sp. NA02950]
MRERIARFMVRWLGTLRPVVLSHLTMPEPPRSAPVRVPAPARVPAAPPTPCLPRLPVGERFPIAWDTDPVPLYILQHERLRTLGVR